MSDERLDQILSLSDAVIIDGGAAIAFTLTTTAGEARLCVPQTDLGNIIGFFAVVAHAVGRALSANDLPSSPIRNDVPTLPISGLGLATSDTPDTYKLVVNLSGFGLAFEMPNSGLADELRKLAQTAQTLSAKGLAQ
jgi:hypothetical protein